MPTHSRHFDICFRLPMTDLDINAMKKRENAVAMLFAVTIALGSFRRAVKGEFIVFRNAPLKSMYASMLPRELGGTASRVDGIENLIANAEVFRKVFVNRRFRKLKTDLAKWVPKIDDPDFDSEQW